MRQTSRNVIAYLNRNVIAYLNKCASTDRIVDLPQVAS